MKPTPLFLLLAALLASPHSRAADPAPEDPDQQLRGASAMALLSKGETVHRTLQVCAQRYPALALRSELVESGWKERNGRYLALLPLLERESLQAASAGGRQAEWREFLDKRRPLMLDKVREMFVAQLEDAPENVREALCGKFANDFAAGRFDFAADTQIIGYLERRLQDLPPK